MMNKIEIRKKLKNIRNNMSNNEVQVKSKNITQKLIKTISQIESDIYFIYNSYNNEVRTNETINYLLENNKQVFLPKITTENMFSIPYNQNTKLEKNHYNILEPTGEHIDLNNFICIIPLVAIDTNGHRIGQGKGYYDKFLKNKKCLKIGICYDYQILDFIPYEKHDVTLDIIISEKRIINLQNKSRN